MDVERIQGNQERCQGLHVNNTTYIPFIFLSPYLSEGAGPRFKLDPQFIR